MALFPRNMRHSGQIVREGYHMKNILNVAHRGFHLNYPDNTLEAFKSAIDLGVDGIEMDIQETADGAFVVFHDRKLNGVDVINLPLSDIRNVWLQDEYEIPTLEQALDLCNQKLKLFIELKIVKSLEKLLKILTEKAAMQNNMVLSFNESLLADISQLSSYISTAHITAFPFGDVVKLAISARCKGMIVLYPFINERLLEKTRANGLSVYVWGCPDIEAARKAMQLDIDGIITDFPHMVKEQT